LRVKEQYLQDWPTWVNNDWVDEVCPQIYRYDIEKYQNELSKIMIEHIIDGPSFSTDEKINIFFCQH
jgi:uncharacterized lipoprotein YddW (UPF0748 family)